MCNDPRHALGFGVQERIATSDCPAGDLHSGSLSEKCPRFWHEVARRPPMTLIVMWHDSLTFFAGPQSAEVGRRPHETDGLAMGAPAAEAKGGRHGGHGRRRRPRPWGGGAETDASGRHPQPRPERRPA